MRQKDFDALLKWLAYPALFKNAVRKSVETGLAFKILADETLTEDIKNDFKILMQDAVPKADLNKLMKVYERTFPKIKTTYFNNQIYRLQSDILRIPPSQRV
jgi:hypothetical protein